MIPRFPSSMPPVLSTHTTETETPSLTSPTSIITISAMGTTPFLFLIPAAIVARPARTPRSQNYLLCSGRSNFMLCIRGSARSTRQLLSSSSSQACHLPPYGMDTMGRRKLGQRTILSETLSWTLCNIFRISSSFQATGTNLRSLNTEGRFPRYLASCLLIEVLTLLNLIS